MGMPTGFCVVRREGGRTDLTPIHVAQIRRSCGRPESASNEGGRQPGIPAGEGLHTVKPFIPEVGPGRTHSAVKLLAQKAETSVILF